MNSTFDNFDSEETSKGSKPQYNRPQQQRPARPQRTKAPTSLSANITVSGKPILLQTTAVSDADLDESITALKDKFVDLLNGMLKIPIGDNRASSRKCHSRLSCDKGWSGEHGASHTTAAWLIWEMLKPVYDHMPHAITDIDQSQSNINDVWDVQEQSNDNYYCHVYPENLPYAITTVPRENNDPSKLRNLFREIFVDFFAGRRGLPRIGALVDNAKRHDYPIRYCNGPFCYRTLLAPSTAEAKTACGSFHSDEVSFLTSLARVLVECRKHKHPALVGVSAITTMPNEQRNRRAREPREPKRNNNSSKYVSDAASAKATLTNAFEALQEVDEPEETKEST